MKRLLLLALLAFAGWYGWKHYDQVLHPRPHHEAVVHNESGEKLVRVRLTVGRQTFVKEELPDGESATFPFTVDADSPFDLSWEYDTKQGEQHWSGGLVAKGPIIARHTMTIRPSGGVIIESQNL